MTMIDAIGEASPLRLLWMLWLAAVLLGVPAVLMLFGRSRRLGALVVLAALMLAVGKALVFRALGDAQLLAIVSLLVLVPLGIYAAMWWRARRHPLPWALQTALIVLIGTLGISAVTDATSLALHVAGGTRTAVALD